MRSRFAAFAVGDVEYLWRTLHPDHHDRALPKHDVLRALRAASQNLKYMRLQILDEAGERILFRASVFEKGQDRSFVELSLFAHDGMGWRYLEGESRDPRALSEPGALTIESFLALGASPP